MRRCTCRSLDYAPEECPMHGEAAEQRIADAEYDRDYPEQASDDVCEGRARDSVWPKRSI